jgi:hypothetical protein
MRRASNPAAMSSRSPARRHRNWPARAVREWKSHEPLRAFHQSADRDRAVDGRPAVIGAGQLFIAAVASLPNVNYPTISVTAQLPGADLQTMASTVASPLELQFGQIPASPR